MTKPLPFTRFCSEVLRVKLTPGQTALASVAFDGVQPSALEGELRELARQILGDVEDVPHEVLAVFVAVCGARGGKSYVLCALRLLHLALTVPLASLAPGEVASGLIVAPDLRLARQTLRFALGAAKATRKIAALIESQGIDGFTIRREGGRSVSLECLPATRGGSAVRGRSLVGAVLDECAFFRDEDYQVNDAELFKAIAPRIMPEGQVILASTPWAEGVGLLAELFAANHGAPRTALAAHAPTLLLRNDVRTRAMVARERERDPDNAAREFDAEFMTAGAGLFFDPKAIAAAVDPDLVLPLAASPAMTATIGADFGFRSDSSALVATLFDGRTCHVADVVELRPAKGRPLQPSAVVAAFAERAKAFGCAAVISDRHYEEAIREHLAAERLRLDPAPDGNTGKVETYTRARALLNEGRVRLPNHPRLLNQLRSITGRPTPGGGLSIAAPRRGASGHGDIVSALVLALAQSPASAEAPWLRGVLTSEVEPVELDAA
jgi:hypothetical protein